MTQQKHPTLRSILDKYSPFSDRWKALRLLARPVQAAVEAAQLLLRWPFDGAENKAGQHITGCRPAVISTFARMEKKLSASFNAAAGHHAAPDARRAFLGLAAEVRADAAVLEQHCTILRQKFDVVTERHAFVLGHSLDTPVLLEDAVTTVTARLQPRAETPLVIPANRFQQQPQPQALAQ